MRGFPRVIPLMSLALGCADDAVEGVGTVRGELVWEAELPDGSQCTYARTYEGVEDRSAPWLCPECALIWRAEMVDFRGEDCLERMGAGRPADREWLGWGGDGFFRATLENARLLSSGDAMRADDALEVAHEAEVETDEGVIDLRISGRLALGHTRADPMHGFTPPRRYACGWDRSDRSAYAGSWTLAVGRTLPDGWFRDGCDEPVRLHDLGGRYVVVDVSAVDCPPCLEQAHEQRDFLDDMRRRGLDVEVVTLLAPSLGAVLSPTPPELLEAWSDAFGLDSPVLSDRGWGLFVVGAAVPSFGYPTSVVVAPDLRVLDVSVGFSGWGGVARRIEEHARR